MRGIVFENIRHILENPHLQRLAVLLQEEHIAPAIGANFRGEFRKAAGIRQIDVRIGLEAMPVASRNRRQTKLRRQLRGPLILLPRPQPVQFQRMDEGSVRIRERVAGAPPPHSSIGAICFSSGAAVNSFIARVISFAQYFGRLCTPI